jgi:tetratricopeptide repeat protein
MNAGKYGRSSAALKELLALDPHNTEARRLFATLHLRLGSLVTARQAFESLGREAIERQDYWLAESLLREYLAAGPRCVPFLELLAHVFEEKGDAMAAAAELGKAIDILVEDPDPDSPKKPGQLYAKIRELAPASPAAFRLAAMFDIQTGEFLRSPSRPPVHPPAQNNTPTSPEGAAPQPHAESATEVMPWEQADGAPSVTISLSVPFLSPAEPGEVQVGIIPSVTDLEEESVNPVAPDIQDWNADQTIETNIPSSPESLVAEPEHTTSALAESLPESEISTTENLSIQSSSDDSAEIPPAPERSEALSSETVSIASSSSLSSPMPWEQVEESTIRIAESEPTPSAEIEQDPLPAQKSETDVVLTALSQPELATVPPAASVPPEESPIGKSAVAQAAAETSAEPSTPAVATACDSPSASFSWEAIFHKAWTFSTKSSDESPSSTIPNAHLPLVNDPSQETDGIKTTPVLEVETSTVPSPTILEPTFLLRESGSTQEVAPPSVAEPLCAQEQESVAPIFETVDPSIHLSPESELQSTVPAEPLDAGPASLEELALAEPPPADEEHELSTKLDETTPSVAIAPPKHALSSIAQAQETIQERSLPPVPEPASDQLTSVTSTDTAALASAPAVPVESASPHSTEPHSHWSTGEVAVQHHRPSRKKRQREKEFTEPSVPDPNSAPSYDEPRETVVEPVGETVARMSEAVPTPLAPITPEEDTRPEWVRESESVTFVRQEPQTPSAWDEVPSDLTDSKLQPEPVVSAAASAVDVLFESTGRGSQVRTHDRLVTTKPRPRVMARLHRVRIGIVSFVGSCFSTTRSLVISLLTLVVICAVLTMVGIVAIEVAWRVMEEPPNAAYQSLTTGPQRSSADTKKNSYFLLLGFEAPRGRDAAQAGYERKSEDNDISAARACLKGDDEARNLPATSASSSVMKGWLKSSDPAARFKGQAESVRSWTAQESTALGRYQQWLKLPFEDWGFGEIVSPNCPHILLTHRLYLAEGFGQDLATGLERLETDMEAWRSVLAQSKTLMIKMLAADAVRDDVAIASGLLIRPDLDGASIARLGKIVRPLDQVELSVRWPMQSYFTWATKTVKTALKQDRTDERPLHVSFAAAMSLPVQRRSNDYANYYETANRAVAEGRYLNLPKMSSFIRVQAVSAMDYLVNPIEHIIGIEPLPSWDPYIGHMVETDAQLRLASLQVWIRRGPQEGAFLTRLAKAGQSYYDPFTGLPMLVNSKKGLMYSVGQDGKDQEGDPTHDVVAVIPPSRSETGESLRTAGTSKGK